MIIFQLHHSKQPKSQIITFPITEIEQLKTKSLNSGSKSSIKHKVLITTTPSNTSPSPKNLKIKIPVS